MLGPQEGPQSLFLKCSADIAIFGGSAGCGKTYALLMEPIRNVGVQGFGAVIFRREANQITMEGGLWDTALQILPGALGKPRIAPVRLFQFPSGSKVSFHHLHQETSVLDWHGSQIPLLMFDELQQFTEGQFFYMLSRNRSVCGIPPYVRATCNADADSWLGKFLAWWIDQRTGYPIPERSGKVRYMARVGDNIVWGDTREEVQAQQGVKPEFCKSVTFIPGFITDNPILMKTNPQYLANLHMLSTVQRERLLSNNWKIKPAAGMYFPRNQARIINQLPANIVKWCRAWDFAATIPTSQNPNPDYTVGLRMAKTADGLYVITNLNRFRQRSADVRQAVKKTADIDGRDVRISIPQDPGSAGKEQAESYAAMLAGKIVTIRRRSADKVATCEPFASQWQAGNVYMLRAAWNDEALDELEFFPEGAHDDIPDAGADAFFDLTNSGGVVAGVMKRAIA